MGSTDIASANAASATLFPSHHPRPLTATPARLAWTAHLSPAGRGHSGEDENSGSLEPDGSHQPGASQLPAQPDTVLGPHIPAPGFSLLPLGAWGASYLWGEVLGHNFLPFFSQFFIWSHFIFCLKEKREKNNKRFAYELLITAELSRFLEETPWR